MRNLVLGRIYAPLRTAVASILVFALLSVGFAAPAFATYFSNEWHAGTGRLPQVFCPRWTLLNSANVEVPQLNPLRLVLNTNSSGEIMMYTQQGPDFTVNPSTQWIQFRMRYVSGNTTDTTRRVASVLFQTDGPTPVGNILWIGQDEIFLWSSDATIGPRAFVDTDGSYHTYLIEWEASGGTIKVYRDGASFPTLTGSHFNRPQWTSQARIVWGHQFFGAQGESRWQSIFHSYDVTFNGGGDEDLAPDSCDNCVSNWNPGQDDADHNGVGDRCEVQDTLQFTLRSPVDVVVTDPSLDSIGKTFNVIQDGSTYTDNTDVNGDGDPDDIVTIPLPLAGQYLIRIFPETGANPGDKYTLTIRINGNQLIIPEGHHDASVSSLPATFVWTAAGTLPGDVNADGKFTAADIIYMVNYIFKGGPGPVVPGHADTNCDNQTTSADLIRMVNFVFKSSTPPCSRTSDYPT